MLKIRRPLGRLIFNMGIAIPGKTVFLIETAPRKVVNVQFVTVVILIFAKGSHCYIFPSIQSVQNKLVSLIKEGPWHYSSLNSKASQLLRDKQHLTSVKTNNSQVSFVTHSSRNKNAVILQATYSAAFSWLKINVFYSHLTGVFCKGPSDNNPSLVQITALRRSGDKPLPEPMMVWFAVTYMFHYVVMIQQCGVYMWFY